MKEKLVAKVVSKPNPLIIVPSSPRLNLQPVFDRIFISSPDEGSDHDKVGGIHLPGNSTMMNAYAEVTVEACGPDVKSVAKGDRVLVVRPQCNKISYQGNSYFFTTEVAVMGIIR